MKMRLGLCAMDKKVKSKAMKELLIRLPDDEFDVVYFGDDCILNKPLADWPKVDGLIAFNSKGFPLQKAMAYVEQERPLMINNFQREPDFLDRRAVYGVLETHGIPVPRYVTANHSDPNSDFEEHDDWIVVKGVTIRKPFVEKPFDANDHNIYLYYPMNTGGGSKRLFRKIGDRSSQYYPDVHHVRTSGGYIYEEFLVTQGTDVKVYAVGKDYGHAEARKSPVVDGKVNRDADGKEIRYPVLLSSAEKLIVQRCVEAFDQNVLGFDLLRTRGASYVCDVNGWSFVKGSRKYYDDCGMIIRRLFLELFNPQYLATCLDAPALLPLPTTTPSQDVYKNLLEAYNTKADYKKEQSSLIPEQDEEVRCVVGVFRHGDREPKQKMKMAVSHPAFLRLHAKYSATIHAEAKLKSVAQMVELLEVTSRLLSSVGLADSSVVDSDRHESAGSRGAAAVEPELFSASFSFSDLEHNYL